MGRTTSKAAAEVSALTTIVGCALLSITTRAVPQELSPDALSFEVASVRPNTSGGFSFVGVQVQPSGAVTAENVSLRRIIAFAYGLDVYQTVEGRSKLLDQNFDIRAKTAPDVRRPRAPEMGPVNFMMQRLLSQRFKLAVRGENRVQNGYSLVRAKPNGALGSRIKSSDFVCPRPVDAPRTPSLATSRLRF